MNELSFAVAPFTGSGQANPRVTDYRCHTHTASPPTDIEDVRHALRDKK